MVVMKKQNVLYHCYGATRSLGLSSTTYSSILQLILQLSSIFSPIMTRLLSSTLYSKLLHNYNSSALTDLYKNFSDTRIYNSDIVHIILNQTNYEHFCWELFPTDVLYSLCELCLSPSSIRLFLYVSCKLKKGLRCVEQWEKSRLVIPIPQETDCSSCKPIVVSPEELCSLLVLSDLFGATEICMCCIAQLHAIENFLTLPDTVHIGFILKLYNYISDEAYDTAIRILSAIDVSSSLYTMGRRLEDVSRGVLARKAPTGYSSSSYRIHRDRPENHACQDSLRRHQYNVHLDSSEQMSFDTSKPFNFQVISELNKKHPFSSAQQENCPEQDKRDSSPAYSKELAGSGSETTRIVPCDNYSVSDRSQSSVTESGKDSNASNSQSVHHTESPKRPCHGRASLIRGLIDELRIARSMSTHSASAYASQLSNHCIFASEECSSSTTLSDRKQRLQRPVPVPSALQLSRGQKHEHEHEQDVVKNESESNENENERVLRHMRQRQEDLEYLRTALGVADTDGDADSVAGTNLWSEQGEDRVSCNTGEDSLFLSLCSDTPTSCSAQTSCCLSDCFISPSVSSDMQSNDHFRPSAHLYFDNIEGGMDIGPRYVTAQNLPSDVGDTFESDFDLLSDRNTANHILDQYATLLHPLAVNKARMYSSDCLQLLQDTCECDGDGDPRDFLLSRLNSCCDFSDHQDSDQEQISPPTSLWENSQSELLGTIYYSGSDESEPTVLHPFAQTDQSAASDELTPSLPGREHTVKDSVEGSLTEEAEDIRGLIDGLLGLADYFHRETASQGRVLHRTPTPALCPHPCVGNAADTAAAAAAAAATMRAYLCSRPFITLCLMRAEGLSPVLGSTDAYAVLDWGRLGRFVSRVVENSTDPVFNESFEFHLSHVLDDSLVVENDYFRSDTTTDELGSIPVLTITLYCRRRSIQDEVLGTGTLDFDSCRVGRNTIRLRGVSDDSECGTLSLSIF